MKRRWLEEWFFHKLMLLAFLLVIASLAGILVTVLVKGLPALNWAMLTQTPQGGYYLGKGGGVLNAIIGSLYLAGGATLLAFILSLPLALFLGSHTRTSRQAELVRLALDVLWGTPSILYGVLGFTMMMALGMRASLFWGILVLALLELPIMTRTIDEVIRKMPAGVGQASLALGATRLETYTQVVVRQILPGIVTAILLAFGRGIGDAASVLFTAGFTDRIPDSLFGPAASLPLSIFFQLGTPFPEVRQRAYASALILTFLVLLVSLGARGLSRRLGRYVVR